MLPSPLELSANAVNAVSILLAARNSIHTWWTGILGCALFGLVFFDARLYADAVLQIFFIGTSAYGWRLWWRRPDVPPLPITRTPPRAVARYVVVGIVVALSYAGFLKRYTDAYAPLPDSFVLVFSVVAQLLLMRRRYEAWWFWLLVNTISVVLFGARELWVTAVLYAAFWINALVATIRWRRWVASR